MLKTDFFRYGPCIDAGYLIDQNDPDNTSPDIGATKTSISLAQRGMFREILTVASMDSTVSIFKYSDSNRCIECW